MVETSLPRDLGGIWLSTMWNYLMVHPETARDKNAMSAANMKNAFPKVSVIQKLILQADLLKMGSLMINVKPTVWIKA